MQRQLKFSDKISMSFLLLSISTCACADYVYDDNFNPRKPFLENPNFDYYVRPFVALAGGGAAASELGQSKVFPNQYPVSDQLFSYTAKTTTQFAYLADVFLGVEWAFNTMSSIELGVDYNQTGYFPAKGVLKQGPDERSLSQFSYSYRIQPRQLLLQTKVLYTNSLRYHPYFLLGVGYAYNSAADFNTSVPNTLTYTQQFGSQTAHSFSYRLGLGVDLDINPHFRLGIGYSFANYGRASLGSGSIAGVPVARTLTQTSLPVNELMLQLTLIK